MTFCERLYRKGIKTIIPGIEYECNGFRFVAISKSAAYSYALKKGLIK